MSKGMGPSLTTSWDNYLGWDGSITQITMCAVAHLFRKIERHKSEVIWELFPVPKTSYTIRVALMKVPRAS
jgi:hypothetical protein